jgi:hypothetical protein
MLDRIEWLFPLRGRWLRSFLVGVGVGLWLFWCVGGLWFDWEMLPTLLSADPQYIDCRLSSDWTFGCSGGISMAGHTGMAFSLGPIEVTWLAPDFQQSWAERTVRACHTLGLAIAAVCIVMGTIRHFRDKVE